MYQAASAFCPCKAVSTCLRCHAFLPARLPLCLCQAHPHHTLGGLEHEAARLRSQVGTGHWGSGLDWAPPPGTAPPAHRGCMCVERGGCAASGSGLAIWLRWGVGWGLAVPSVQPRWPFLLLSSHGRNPIQGIPGPHSGHQGSLHPAAPHQVAGRLSPSTGDLPSSSPSSNPPVSS